MTRLLYGCAGSSKKRQRAIAIRDLFVDVDEKTKDLVFMPVEYRISFRCHGEGCTGHDMSILDWEIYTLSRKLYAQGTELAEHGTIAKIRECLDPAKKDAYFFLGNTQAHPASFMIVGLYYPPKVAPPRQQQLNLIG